MFFLQMGYEGTKTCLISEETLSGYLRTESFSLVPCPQDYQCLHFQGCTVCLFDNHYETIIMCYCKIKCWLSWFLMNIQNNGMEIIRMKSLDFFLRMCSNVH